MRMCSAWEAVPELMPMHAEHRLEVQPWYLDRARKHRRCGGSRRAAAQTPFRTRFLAMLPRTATAALAHCKPINKDMSRLSAKTRAIIAFFWDTTLMEGSTGLLVLWHPVLAAMTSLYLFLVHTHDYAILACHL